MPKLNFRCIALVAIFAMGLNSIPAQAEIDFGSLSSLSANNPESPIPNGLVVGGVVISGQARYQSQDDALYVIPGAVYFGEQFMYLGDRARYYFYKEGNVSAFAYGRVRFGNLDPEDSTALIGMNKREWQLEAGIGANVVTPYALFTVRAASDVTGTSKGQEALVWADFPIVKDKLLIMPGAGLMIRSENMANYYFGGVSASEAMVGRPEWNTGTTVSPMFSLLSSYRFNKNWLGLAAVSYELYDKGIKNSPLVQHSGELYVITGLGYIW